MVSVIEVKTKKQQKEFIDFPLALYKGNDCYVPPLYGDEKKMFRADFVYNDTCKTVFYNAYRDGAMVGRIQGILQTASNEKTGEKRVRFDRFDSIDDEEVASALFGAVENWARSIGMDTVVGPLGYSDLEREGLLVEGFDELSTFEEQYNFPYYEKLITAQGYEKEVEWVEFMLRAPKDDDGSLKKMADFVMKRYDLHFGQAKNVRDFLGRYGKQFFELLDVAYKDIYGTVPFTPGMIQMMEDNFKLIIDLKHVAVILDKDDNIVCLGICFPSLARALQKSGGKLTPAALVRVLHDVKHPKIIDLGLVGVDPEYMNRGVSTVICAELIRMLNEDGVEYAETNLNLVDNASIINQWKRFDARQHKRRRAYVKKLVTGDNE